MDHLPTYYHSYKFISQNQRRKKKNHETIAHALAGSYVLVKPKKRGSGGRLINRASIGLKCMSSSG